MYICIYIYIHIYIYIYIFVYCYIQRVVCWLQCIRQSREGRCGKGIKQESSHRQSGQSTLITWHMMHSVHSTQWHTHTRTHAHTHTRMHTRTHACTHACTHTHMCMHAHWNNLNPSFIISCATPDLSESERMCHLRTTMEISACTFCVIRIFKYTLYLYNAYVYNVLHFILNKSKKKSPQSMTTLQCQRETVTKTAVGSVFCCSLTLSRSTTMLFCR